MQWIYHVPNLTRYFFCYCMVEAPLKVEKTHLQSILVQHPLNFFCIFLLGLLFMIMIILNVKHSAFVALLIATALIGIVNGRQSRIMRFQPETQLSTAVRSSPPPSSSLSPTDDSWFSWANWRSILLQNGESQAGGKQQLIQCGNFMFDKHLTQIFHFRVGINLVFEMKIIK